MYLPMRAHWRHLANTIELVLPFAHPSPQPKWQIDQLSHFCTVHGTVSSGIPGHVLSPNNCPFAWGIWAHLIPASSGPPESITQTPSWSVGPFLHSSHQIVVRHVGHTSPPQNCRTHGDLYPRLICGSLVHPTQQPKQYLDRFSRFCTAHGRESLYFAMGAHFP